MKQSWLIAKREVRERISSRSFLTMAILGPLLVLASLYFLFVIGGNEQQKWKVLISDKAEVFENKIMASNQADIQYNFYANYIEIEDFATNPKYKKYDALVEINEKILTNKLSFVFYRERPSFNMSVNLRYQVERRLEEVLATELHKVPLSTIRSIKTPLNMTFRNVYDPENISSDYAPWVGLGFGLLIFLFIYLFGTSILRSIGSEKNNRVVEVVMSRVSAENYLFGKILGIGISALIQLFFWSIVIGLGLYLFREFIFVNQYDPSQIAEGLPSDYNQFVELVYERIQFTNFFFYFIVFLFLGYLFYGSFFAALGAGTGSENDGQQYLIPLVLMLCFSLYAGYYVLNNPESSLSTFYLYLPFTAPVAAMVRFAQGFGPGESYHFFLSICVLTISAFLMLRFASKIYKGGILHFGHQLRLKNILSWLKQK